MKKICLEMPVVTKCMVNVCVYNFSNSCHARAISIGDSNTPGCDTFMGGMQRARSIAQIAGVGACKTVGCKFNDDLECMAEGIQVGMVNNAANCTTFALR